MILAAVMSAGPAWAAAGPDAVATPPGLCPSVAQNEDAAHNGDSCTTLPASLKPKWSVTLSGRASYPLIAAGKVFVVTSSSDGGYGGQLYALDAHTGKSVWGPIPLSATDYWFTLAYGGGNVYVNNSSGTVAAYQGSNGKEMWAQETGDFSGEPVAYGGDIYLQSGASVVALSQKTGAVLWKSEPLDGDGGSVSVDGDGVYVAGGCSWFRLSLKTGAVIWSGNSGCTGNGGGTTYLDGRLDFETVGDLVVNAHSGKTLGTFSGVPAFSGADGYFATGGSIYRENVHNFTPESTITLPQGVDVCTSPVIAGHVLFVGATNGMVYGFDTRTGATAGQYALPGVPGGGGQYSAPPSDISVGNGLLVVPTGSTVTAFG